MNLVEINILLVPSTSTMNASLFLLLILFLQPVKHKNSYVEEH